MLRACYVAEHHAGRGNRGSVTGRAEAERATKEYVYAIQAIQPESRVPPSSSSRPSWGSWCARNLDTLLAAAAEHGVLAEVDMEHSSVWRAMLETYCVVT